mgnify:CR=1 FL=1
MVAAEAAVVVVEKRLLEIEERAAAVAAVAQVFRVVKVVRAMTKVRMEMRVEMEVKLMVVLVVKVVRMIMKLTVVAVAAVAPPIQMVHPAHQLVVKEGPELMDPAVALMEMVEKVEMEMVAAKIMVVKVLVEMVEKVVMQSLDNLGFHHQPLTDQVEFMEERTMLELIK